MRFRHKFTFLLLTAVATISLGLFAVWWFQPSHIPNNFTGYARIIDVLLFIVVSYVIWHPLVMGGLSWAIASHIKEDEPPAPPPGMRVAFLTTFVPASEPIELLHKTLPAMVAIEYPHDTWLLDEGNDPAAKAFCESIGVKYFSRKGIDHYNQESGKYTQKTKGGNHNSWHDQHGHNYDFVAQMDTDFIPDPSFLTKTLGYFRDPKVAFVGTPQIYGNTESFIAKAAAEQTYSFYGPILRGFFGMNTTLLIGANHVLRREALEDVDHYSAHITEDLLTGMKLHAKGWKSVYVPQALAIGEGPTTWKAYFSQQMRWAYGCVDILLRHSPHLFRMMSFRRKVYYYFLQQHYFSGIAMMLSIFSLGFYFLLGLNSADIMLSDFFVKYLPVVLLSFIATAWLQVFNVRRKEESGINLAGMLISIAAWPIFFMACWKVIRGKKLVYKVTPKGSKNGTGESRFYLFKPHLFIGLFCLLCLAVSIPTNRQSPLMYFFAISSALFMFLSPFVEEIYTKTYRMYSAIFGLLRSIHDHSKFYEINTKNKGVLPSLVTSREKYAYMYRHHRKLLFFSLLSFIPGTASMISFAFSNSRLVIIQAFVLLTIAYFIVSIIINLFTKDFDVRVHRRLVTNWKPNSYPTVDIFLPIAGEPIDVLNNTWEGVSQLIKRYEGHVTVYCLDDGASREVQLLSQTYGFNYMVRPNRGEFKKAGNLRHGFEHSKGDFIAIFDADFRPRFDFLNELLPYFYSRPELGIVQSPQFFDVRSEQNWLERGAGAVQELFYKHSQVSRQTFDAAICVGSNAIYRRRALNDIGGTALIEHSEDVHTGFNLAMKGWKLQYVPVVLAKGLCPSTMQAFFKQQYRWCMGSMTLLSSKKFWKTKLSFRARLSYMSGFMYYIHTAISAVLVPFIPLAVLLQYDSHVNLMNFLLIAPSLFFVLVVVPLWHKATYGVEAWSTRLVYGWAHLFAIFDYITGNRMQWKPTGGKMKIDIRYINFRIMQFVFNFVPAVAWVGISGHKIVAYGNYNFIPIFIGGLYYLMIAYKVVFFIEPKESMPARQIIGKPSRASLVQPNAL